MSANIKQYLTLGLLAIIWGSSFILMKIGLTEFTNWEVAALRLVSAALVLQPFLWQHIGQVKSADWKWLAGVGLLGNGIPAFLFTTAQTQISSSLSGMLNSLTPLFALIIGAAFFTISASRKSTFGVLVGLVGAIILILFSGGNSATAFTFDTNTAIYSSLAALAAACYGFSVNFIKSKLDHLRPMVITAAALTLCLPISIFILVQQDFTAHLANDYESWKALTATVTLGIVGTSIALLIFNTLIKQTTALFASSVTYMIPIVAIAWGVADGEAISTFQLVGIGLILGGVKLVR